MPDYLTLFASIVTLVRKWYEGSSVESWVLRDAQKISEAPWMCLALCALFKIGYALGELLLRQQPAICFVVFRFLSFDFRVLVHF